MTAFAPDAALHLLAGPPASAGPESLAAHHARLGPRPTASADAGAELIAVLRRRELRGRGGAAFPTATKWAAVAGASRGRAVVVANGAEGEPASRKDRRLLATRPHLVLDGLCLAAEAVGARTAVVFVPRAFGDAVDAVRAAVAQRATARLTGPRVEVVTGPWRYVAGEETAVVAHLNGRPARPTFIPPRPYQRGVGGDPTLVQNVETLAHVALLARDHDAPSTALLTVSGSVGRPDVVEAPLDAALDDVLAAAGGVVGRPRAVLFGGYFGTWVGADRCAGLRLDETSLATVGARLGTGVIAMLPAQSCGIAETARVLDFLARESARQCGPCEHGLASVAGTMTALAARRGHAQDAERLRRWASQINGRGACRHPDGAVMLLRSALTTFDAELADHLRRGACNGCRRPALLPTPALGPDWR